MSSVLRRLAVRPLRWLGIGRSPAIGISYDDRRVVAALVHAGDRRIRGVSVVELDPSTVLSGSIERPVELASALRAALGSLRPPAGTPAGACVPVGLDHRGSGWPATRESAGDGDPGAVVAEAAQQEGVDVRVVAPMAVVGARLGELAASGGGGDGRQQPVSVVVRSGWLSSVVSTAARHVECRTERNETFRSPPDVRWGISSDRAGAEVDPFWWPKRVRDRRQLAMLAAGAAMLP